MFEAKKVIPPLAAASLALTGCGDSGDNGGGVGAGGSDATAEAVEHFCMKVVECYEDRTQEGCELVEQRTIDGYISDECLPLWTSYLECRSELSCEEFEGSGFDDCVEQVAQEFGQELFGQCSGDT